MNTMTDNTMTSATKTFKFVASVVIFLFFVVIRPGCSFSQSAVATWPLTSNASVSVTGNITATALISGSGLNTTSFNGTNGATAASFNGTVCNPNSNDYFEFTITPNCENLLTITSVTFDHRASSAATTRCFQLKYSINGGPESQIGSDIPVASTTPTPYSSGTISIDVPMAQGIVFRLYGATGVASTSLSVRNFIVNGNTTFTPGPAPSVVVSSNPSGAICPGTLVTYTASIVNGGNSPSFQWQVNGNAVGSNLPTYTTTALNEGDQVSCTLTSNLLCASPQTVTSNTLTIVFLPTTLPTPGSINGPTLVNLHAPGLTYSINAVPNANTYNWIVPPGWIIDSGTGTTSITVTSGDVGEDGNISVTAANECVSSSPSSLFVGIIPPHNNCNECHITHTSPGILLTGVTGNANLCMSCHNPNGTAAVHPFSNAMKAIPGTGGTSHNWDVAAINALLETNPPSNTSMASRLPEGKIICSTCHNQHNPYVFPSYLRDSNNGDALCKDCHASRNIGTFAGNNNNKGSHPVGVIFDPNDTRFLPSPASPFNYPESRVECSSCHQPHYAVSTDGYLLKAENNDAVCTSCHVEKNPSITLEHEGMSCKTCHYTHSTDKSNILMVRNSIATPNSGNQEVVFSGNGGAVNYADGQGIYNGICEVCHTSTDHYSNTSGGVSDSRHLPATQTCINCHPHNRGFYPVTSCLECHHAITDKPGIGPAGGRRQIVDNTGNGFGTGGDFKRYSHHVNSMVPTNDDCLRCHFMGDHMRGTVKLLDPDQGFLNVIEYNTQNTSDIELFCQHCHDADGANGDLTPFSDNVQVPVVDAGLWNNSAHKAGLSCISCHDNGHGSNKASLLSPYDYSGSGTGTDLTNEEEGFCLGCHGGSGSAAVKVHLAFAYNNTATDFYKHNPSAAYRIHQAGENNGTAFGEESRHAECVDCHNPHAVKSGTATAPALLPALTGTSGVEPNYSGPGAPTGFTFVNSVNAEYQVCFKCHSSYTTLPTYLPGGWDGSAFLPDGLKKLTTGGINNQIADSRDMAQEYNPNNSSYHPVMAEGKNTGINTATFKVPWNSSSRMYCSSCHNNPNAASTGHGRGPHGSQNLHILDQATAGGAVNDYKTYHGDVMASTGDVCGKCHQAASYWTGSSNSRFPYHSTHIDGEKAECYLCHDTHGSEQMHLINFSRNVPNCITAATPNSQNAFAHATGATNSCSITCHGASHSASSRTYTPAYP